MARDISALRRIYDEAHPRTSLTAWNAWMRLALETDYLGSVFAAVDDANADIEAWKEVVEQKEREIVALEADAERAQARLESDMASLRETAAQDRASVQRELDAMSADLRGKEATIAGLREQIVALEAAAAEPEPVVVEAPAPKKGIMSRLRGQ